MSDDDLRRMFKPGKYLGAWELVGREATLTIDRVEPGVVEGENGRKDKAPLVYFKGVARALVLNKTNMKVLRSLFGDEVAYSAKKLVGKRITLYATTCRGAAGGTVDCVRIRPKAPDQKGADSAMPDVPVDQEMRAKQEEQAR